MILEEATYESFGYYPHNLLCGSCKPILAACCGCGKVRKTSNHDYHYFCRSCSLKDNTCALGGIRTKEVKAKLRKLHCGKKATKVTKAKMSKAHSGQKNGMFGLKGDENPNFKGGKKETFKRYRKTEKGKINIRKRLVRRRRKLGYTLLAPLAEGEVGHHVTDEYVIGIPKEVHEKFGGHTRENHRKLILQWLKVNDITKYKIAIKVL